MRQSVSRKCGHKARTLEATGDTGRLVAAVVLENCVASGRVRGWHAVATCSYVTYDELV